MLLLLPPPCRAGMRARLREPADAAPAVRRRRRAAARRSRRCPRPARGSWAVTRSRGTSTIMRRPLTSAITAGGAPARRPRRPPHVVVLIGLARLAAALLASGARRRGGRGRCAFFCERGMGHVVDMFRASSCEPAQRARRRGARGAGRRGPQPALSTGAFPSPGGGARHVGGLGPGAGSARRRCLERRARRALRVPAWRLEIGNDVTSAERGFTVVADLAVGRRAAADCRRDRSSRLDAASMELLADRRIDERRRARPPFGEQRPRQALVDLPVRPMTWLGWLMLTSARPASAAKGLDGREGSDRPAHRSTAGLQAWTAANCSTSWTRRRPA